MDRLRPYTPEKDLKWDGTNLWQQLTGAEPVKSRAIYVAAPGFNAQMLRAGDWKLIVPNQTKKKAGTPLREVELYDLAYDSYETRNLAASMPDRVAALRAQLMDVSKADRDAVAND